MNSRTLLNAFLVMGLGLATSLPVQGNASALPPLQQSECNAATSWDHSDATVLRCVGDVLLAGGTWESESAIVVRADGLIWLRDVSITAPRFELQAESLRIDSDARLNSTGGVIRLSTQGAGGTLTLDGVLSVTGQVIPVSGGAILLQPGQAMTVLPDRSNALSLVPEPEALVMWLAGLALLAWHWRRITPDGSGGIPA